MDDKVPFASRLQSNQGQPMLQLPERSDHTTELKRGQLGSRADQSHDIDRGVDYCWWLFWVLIAPWAPSFSANRVPLSQSGTRRTIKIRSNTLAQSRPDEKSVLNFEEYYMAWRTWSEKKWKNQSKSGWVSDLDIIDISYVDLKETSPSAFCCILPLWQIDVG